MAYAYAPAGSITMEVGAPPRTQLLFAVSAGGFAMAETCPLFNVKLKVSITPDPRLPTSNNPLEDELYLLPQASSTAMDSSAPTPSSPNRFDILSFISKFV